MNFTASPLSTNHYAWFDLDFLALTPHYEPVAAVMMS